MGAVLDEWKVEVDKPFADVHPTKLSIELAGVPRAHRLLSNFIQPLRYLLFLVDAAVRPSRGRRRAGKATSAVLP